MIPCISIASSLGGNIPGSEEAPSFLQKNLTLPLDWKSTIFPDAAKNQKLSIIATLNQELAQNSEDLAQAGSFFLSIEGDHSSAIGVWSGVAKALRPQGELGLIWFDAHMDAHTPLTSETGNIHGMPLAVLLGHGEAQLTQIADSFPKISPQNLALIGVRSFEAGEAELLKKLNVRIYFMDEIHQRGLATVIQEALELVTRHTVAYGISFDLDCIDPSCAPAVGTPVPKGIDGEEFLACLSLFQDPAPKAFELVEYNPFHDKNRETLHYIEKLLEIIICLQGAQNLNYK